MTREIDHAVVDVLVERDGRFLLIEETKPGREGKFSIPGGHIDPHETIIEAAIREVEEESGYIVEPIGLVGIYQAVYPRINVSGPVLAAKVVGGGAVVSKEHPNSFWATVDEVERFAELGQIFGAHVAMAARAHVDDGLLPLSAVVSLHVDEP